MLLAACAVNPAKLAPPEQTDWSARLRSLRAKTGKPLIEERDIDRLRNAGARYAQIDTLLAMRRPDGERLFNSASLTRYIQVGGTPDFALALLTLDGGFTGMQLAQMWTMGVTASWVAELGHFTPAEMHAYALAGGNLEYAHAVYDILWPRYSFTQGHHVRRLFEQQTSPEIVSEMAALKCFDSAEELVRFVEAGGDVNYARQLRSFDGRSIYRFRQLGLDPDEVLVFNDTDKPNALVLFARIDRNDAFESLESIRLFQRIHSEYDMLVRVIASDDEIAPLVASLPPLDLLWIAGHGARDGILLNLPPITGNADDDRMYDERLRISTSDDKLALVIAALKPDATIFLDACETDRPRDKLDNLAEFVRELAVKRHVIAASYSFSHSEIVVDSTFPLRIRFMPRWRSRGNSTKH